MFFLGIDPGSSESAYALITYDEGECPYQILDSDKVENKELLRMIADDEWGLGKLTVAIEGLQSYGMSVGREVFDTAYMIGRLQQLCDTIGHDWVVHNRPVYAKAICGTNKVSDAILRQALLLKYGGDAKGQPLHMLKGASDKRSAFAVIVYHLEKD